MKKSLVLHLIGITCIGFLFQNCAIIRPGEIGIKQTLGKIKGQVNIQEVLQLRGKCNVDGDIYAGKLEVEPTATFNGSCHMGANIVELKVDLSIPVKVLKTINN